MFHPGKENVIAITTIGTYPSSSLILTLNNGQHCFDDVHKGNVWSVCGMFTSTHLHLRGHKPNNLS